MKGDPSYGDRHEEREGGGGQGMVGWRGVTGLGKLLVGLKAHRLKSFSWPSISWNCIYYQIHTNWNVQ